MKEADQIWALADSIATRIQQWLEAHEGKRVYLQFKRVDLLRLTRLQVWSWRHYVSIEEILTLTLPYLRKSMRSEQKNRYGLGVSIAALTGEANEKILIEAIQQQYPDNEHIARWRQEEQERQLLAEQLEETGGLAVRVPALVSILEADSVEDFLQRYSNRVTAARNRFREVHTDPKRKRKLYRGNPWL